jgi:hypothetical protein
MVDDYRYVFVMPPLAELIDADVSKAFEAIFGRIKMTFHNPTNDATNSSPGNAHQGADGRLAALLCKVSSNTSLF